MLAFSGIEDTPIANTDTDRAARLDMAGAAGVTEEEGSLVLPDGTTLYTKSWKVCVCVCLFRPSILTSDFSSDQIIEFFIVFTTDSWADDGDPWND